MFRDRKLTAISCVSMLALTLSLSPRSLEAQEAGDNIYMQTGVISNLSGGAPAVKYIPIHVPRIGGTYDVKINFIKVETSAAAVDAYVKHLDEQARARGEEPAPSHWQETRARLKEVTSKADFEVLDSAGNVIGRASDLGLTTLLRKVKFTASRYDYQVKLRCTEGAGVYHLTLEWR
ncbi:MAG: hypothetical protein JF614_21865 [Acidobacteria bacterium]|jgi:hypothetical protein|nr:hypothetical protein [Acidobacteriota bacterium]